MPEPYNEFAKIMVTMLAKLHAHTAPYKATAKAHPIAHILKLDEFKTYDWGKIYDSVLKLAFVFDGRNILDKKVITEIGFEFRGIGK